MALLTQNEKLQTGGQQDISKILLSVDVSGCPADWSMKNKLLQAGGNVN